MKIKVNTEVLREKIPLVAQAVSGKVNGVGTEILCCMLLTAKGKILELTGVSMEISVVKRMEAEVTEEGKVAVPAKMLSDVVPFCKSEKTTLETTASGKLRIQSGAFKIDLAVMPPESFPVSEKEKVAAFVTVNSGHLREILAAVTGSAAIDLNRAALSGTSLRIHHDTEKGDFLILAALDGYRLAEVMLPVKPPEGMGEVSALLPTKACEKLERLLEGDESVEIGLTSNKRAQFRFNGTTVEINQINGSLPDYNTFVPKEAPTVVSLGIPSLLESIKLGRLLSDTGNLVITANEGGGGSVALDVQGVAGNAKNKIEANLQGPSVTLALNLQYLRDAAEACARLGYSGLFLAANGGTKPVLVKPARADGDKDKPRGKFVIMPLSIPEAKSE